MTEKARTRVVTPIRLGLMKTTDPTLHWSVRSRSVSTHLVDVPQPLADVLKALGVADVVHQHNAHGASVVGGGDGMEPLLTRRVPGNK